ncbi:MAG TPA: flavodoxin domain-containing protein [Gemmatimonadales bacterium]|nr:flavodoxin domain-containing protein [Gemmatimonadales bacterium]
MATILIAYATAYGHTEKIAARVADRLWRAGHRVETARVDRCPPGRSLAGFDAVVIAAPVRFGRHPGAARRFVQRHAAELNTLPSVFVSVCNAASDPGPGGQREAAHYVEDFLQRTHWRPRRTEILAGEVAYTRYGFLMRRVMRQIAAQRGGPTDITRDHDFTDWAAVERIAAELAASLTSGTDARPRAQSAG